MDDRFRTYWSLAQKGETTGSAPPMTHAATDAMRRLRLGEAQVGRARPLTLVFDGLNAFIRNYTAVPEMDVNGEPVGGLVGTLRSIKALVRDQRPTRVLVVWDGEGGSRRRRKMVEGYKMGRRPRLNRSMDHDSPERTQQNFASQLLRTKRYLEAFGVSQVEVDDVEADDVIALVCRHMLTDEEKIIVTTDRDMLQLVDAHTLVYSPTKKLYYTTSSMLERVGVLPENFIYLKALDGDASDNVMVPELKGLGPKTVLKLFPVLAQRPTSLDELFQECERGLSDKNKSRARWLSKILAQKDALFRNVQVMQLSFPIISPQSVQQVRWALQKNPEFTASLFKVSLLREGIQLRDTDMETVFREQHVRSKRAQESDNPS